MLKNQLFHILLLAVFLAACSNPATQVVDQQEDVFANSTNQVKLSSEIEWEQLNPARGDQSPLAGTIWGDRKGTVATGFLAKFVDGFSSPPHIHNVTYRAVVIKGLVHNDDPAAAKMWMPAGSFWTQPAGEAHITAVKGEENIAYVEIDRGPYLVKPIAEASDNGERPVNIDKDNIVWLDASRSTLIEASAKEAAIAFLWENEAMKGHFIKLSRRFDGNIISTGEAFHAVIIAGQADYVLPESNEAKTLDPGSYFTSAGKSKHELSISGGEETIIYIRTDGDISIR